MRPEDMSKQKRKWCGVKPCDHEVDLIERVVSRVCASANEFESAKLDDRWRGIARVLGRTTRAPEPGRRNVSTTVGDEEQRPARAYQRQDIARRRRVSSQLRSGSGVIVGDDRRFH
jgi:hypothetical protein